MTISSFARAIPAQLNFGTLLSDIKKLVENIEITSAEITTQIAQINDVIDAAQAVLSEPAWDDKIDQVFKVVNELAELIQSTDEDAYKKFTQHSVYRTLKSLEEHWSVWSKSIGNQGDSINESISFDKEEDTGDLFDGYSNADLTFGIKVNAEAGFNLAVLNQEDAIASGFKLPNNAVLVNQEVIASFGAGINASGSYQAITLAAQAQAKGEFEYDSFYQVDADEKTYAVVYQMFKAPIMPWSLKNMDSLLQAPNVNGKVNGYQAVSLTRDVTLGLSGEIGVGRSLNTIANLDNKAIDLSVSAALTLKRSFKLNSKVSLFINKNVQDELVITANLLDSTNDLRATDFTLGASIEGLDQVIEPLVTQLLGDTDQFVEKLSKYSKPADMLRDKLLSQVDDDLWAKPLAEVLLGEGEYDDAIKAMVSDELKTALEQHTSPLHVEPAELSSKVFNQVLEVFDVDASTVDNTASLNALKNTLLDTLNTQISGIQDSAKSFEQEIINAITQNVETKLAPLKKLGADIGELINHYDETVTNVLEILLNKYQQITGKIKVALEKSANIQLNLQLASMREISETEQESFTIVIKQPQHPSSARLLRSLVVGDDETSSKLIKQLSSTQAIEYKAQSLMLNKRINSQISLGVNVIGYDTTDSKDVMSDLTIKVDAKGKLSLVHQYKVDANADGFNEKRQAAFDLSYGIAQASLNKAVQGAIGLTYSNSDSALHTVKEMNLLLDSLTLSTLDDDVQALNLSPIITKQEANSAKQKYSNLVLANSTSSVKFLPNNSHSEIEIVMRASADTFERLINADGNRMFTLAFTALIRADKDRYRNTTWRYYRESIEDIVAAYQEMFPAYEDIFKLYQYLTPSGDIKWRLVENELEDSDDFDKLFGQFDSKDWKKNVQRMQDYFEQANALKSLVEEFKEIRKAVASLPSFVDKEAAQALMKHLNQSNERIETHLDDWVKVTSSWTDLANDVYGWLGIEHGGVNRVLLSFLMLLQDAMAGDDLYLVRIELERNDGSHRKVITVS